MKGVQRLKFNKKTNHQPSQLTITWGLESWVLDHRRALIHPALRMVFISDIHIGLYATLRSKGNYLPAYDTTILNFQLQSLIKDYANYHWVLTGDIKHSHKTWCEITTEEREQLQQGFSLLNDIKRVTIVTGNHDVGLADILHQFNFTYDCVPQFQLKHIRVLHQTDWDVQHVFTISGHVHPIFRPKQLGQVIPIFAVGQHQLILPAFNPVAGGYSISRVEHDQWHCYGVFPTHLMDLGPLIAWKH